MIEIIQNSLGVIHCINCTSRSTMHVGLKPWTLSAHWGALKPDDRIICGISAVNRTYTSGPRTELCSTPKRIADHPDLIPPIATDWVHPRMNDSNHDRAVPTTPNDLRSLSIRMPWSTESNAAETSNRASNVTSLESILRCQTAIEQRLSQSNVHHGNHSDGQEADRVVQVWYELHWYQLLQDHWQVHRILAGSYWERHHPGHASWEQVWRWLSSVNPGGILKSRKSYRWDVGTVAGRPRKTDGANPLQTNFLKSCQISRAGKSPHYSREKMKSLCADLALDMPV